MTRNGLISTCDACRRSLIIANDLFDGQVYNVLTQLSVRQIVETIENGVPARVEFVDSDHEPISTSFRRRFEKAGSYSRASYSAVLMIHRLLRRRTQLKIMTTLRYGRRRLIGTNFAISGVGAIG